MTLTAEPGTCPLPLEGRGLGRGCNGVIYLLNYQ